MAYNMSRSVFEGWDYKRLTIHPFTTYELGLRKTQELLNKEYDAIKLFFMRPRGLIETFTFCAARELEDWLLRLFTAPKASPEAIQQPLDDAAWLARMQDKREDWRVWMQGMGERRRYLEMLRNDQIRREVRLRPDLRHFYMSDPRYDLSCNGWGG